MALSPGTRQAATMAALWMLAAGASALGVLYSSEIRHIAEHALGPIEPRASRVAAEPAPSVSAGRTVELKAGAYGHYHASVELNGRPVAVLVDTGASIVALTFEDAAAAGILVRERDFTHRVSTANGLARVAPVTIDHVSLGGITVRDVPGAVMEAGKLRTSLLGMSFLGRLQRVDMRNGTLVLQE